MRTNHSHRGFALVVVLAVLALLIVLAVGFLTRTVAERSAASGFKASVLSRQLADTAVGLVQGQINLASTQGSDVAWVSQPGMVRTFDTSGNLVLAYKLYSANDMISRTVGVASGQSSDLPPATWPADTGVWTDLNAPVDTGNGKIFPILDPGGAGSKLDDDSDNTVAEGFTISGAPASNTYQPAPMPVRWLYVLKDGKLVAPTGTGATARVEGDSKDNPIVGRVGFWTDDDTCKVNINTAGAGTYWDTPRGGSSQEIAFAKFQPAQKEWQRYPGHPAMVNLSAVLRPPSGYSDSQWADEIYKIVPRVVGGGSNQGSALATAPINPDSDRLYANVDELIFKPDRTANPVLTKSQVEQAKFFLTARSRAPETNLFNLPRIACWPIYKLSSNRSPDMTRTTAFDRLIAFCSTINGRPYIFQRQLANSPLNDIGISDNGVLYKYLQYLSGNPIPGFGGKFSTKYGADRDQILTEIFDYIRCENLSDDQLNANLRFTPNNGLAGLGWVAPTRYDETSTQGFGRSYTISEFAIGVICNAIADDPDTKSIDESVGSNYADANAPTTPAGAFINPVLGGTPLQKGEMYIQAAIVPEFFSVMQGWVQLGPLMRIKMRGLGSITAKVGDVTYPLFPDANDEADYSTILGSNANQITNWGGNPSYRLFGQGKGVPARGSIPADTVQPFYPFIGTPVKIVAPPTGGSMVLGKGSVTLELYSGTSGPMDTSTLIQKITITMDKELTMPLPKLATGVVGTMQKEETWGLFNNVDYNAPGKGLTRYKGRFNFINGNPNPGGGFFLENYDSVRSFLPLHGDYRLIAGNGNLQSGDFVPHPYSTDTSRRIAVSLSSSDPTGRMPGSDKRGTLIHGVTYPDWVIPDMPYLDGNAPPEYWPDSTGDFDTGVSVAADGPYINKPDEGNMQKRTATAIPYFDEAYFATQQGATFFSPNRQIPSPGMFGSLSTGVKAGIPWRTLLFRPQPDHFGAKVSPKDHLMLDFFWMPVVEPYAISDRFSTAGKINMNYQILPFTYIKRSTGLRALFDSEMISAIPVASVGTYKPNIRNSAWSADAAKNPSFRLAINPSETLSQFQDRFDSGGIFKSASEICDLHIVPKDFTLSNMKSSFWTTYSLTGDNLRERIYTTLYPRLTTKSNTYTVHFRAQSLKKLPTSAEGTWTEGKDAVTGEYRGSTPIERFIDSNNKDIPDYAGKSSEIPSLDPLDKFYRWRVVENRQFAP